MNPSKFELPGSDLLRQSKNLFGDKKDPPQPPREILVKSPGGSGGRSGKKAKPNPENSDLEPLDIPLQPEPPEERPKEPEAKLSEPEWKVSTTRFQEEAEVSVKLKLPPGKEHLTRVEAELHAKTKSGSEVVSKADSHVDASGKASFVLPVHYPTEYAECAVEYFLVFKHRLAKALDTFDVPRTVTEVALKAADYSMVTGIGFAKDSSFIGPDSAEDLKKLEAKYKEWQKKFPKGQIVVYGHAETDEKDGKALSERRAKSAYAFISNDASAWEEISKAESWGLGVFQILLKDAGHDPGKPDGHDGPRTQAAFKSFQKQAGIPESGKADSATRKALFGAYMRGKHDIKVDASRFRKVDGDPWMGCGSRNRVEGKDGAHAENRRVTFLLIDECKAFPVHFPCKEGNESTCERKCKVEGVRSAPGIKCWFYDRLVHENVPALPQESKKKDAVPPWMDVAIKEAKRWKGAKEDEISKSINYHQEVGFDLPDLNGTTHAWCASFVNYCLQTSGYKKSKIACAARSFADDDNFEKVDSKIFGSIAMVERYHVGFLYAVDEKSGAPIFLGGNQSDQINFSPFKGGISYYLPKAYKAGNPEYSSPKSSSAKELNAEFGIVVHAKSGDATR